MSRMKLGFVLNGVGMSWGDWRHPDMPNDACTDFAYNVRKTLVAERGKFDYVFIADGVYADAQSLPKILSHLEPMALLSAIAALTRHIGLVATVSVTYTEPYNLARQMASLDMISGGRAGWNIVTTASPNAARNFGQTSLLPHAERYHRAAEFLEVVKGLWDSFEDGAIVGDKARGVFLDPARLHTLDHHGDYFNVRGPLNLHRMPQGRPVFFQAGSSEEGRDFAARHAEAIFVSPKSFEDAQAFTADIKRRTAAYGRDPDGIFVLPGASPLVGSTEEEVARLSVERASYTPIDGRVRMLSEYFSGYDFFRHALDDRFPQDIPEQWLNGYRGTAIEILRQSAEQRLTLRDAALRWGGRPDDFEGTPEQVADRLQYWLEQRACDGFMLSDSLPDQFEVFVEHVVPILQKRGLFREDYAGATLRDNLGLSVPANRYARA